MKISGTILDKKEMLPLEGANINMVDANKVTPYGTNADATGKFTYEHPDIVSTTPIKISFIGFKPRMFSASELQNKTITLEEDVVQLDELVIEFIRPTASADNGSGFLGHVKRNKKPYILAAAVVVAVASIILIKKSV